MKVKLKSYRLISIAFLVLLLSLIATASAAEVKVISVGSYDTVKNQDDSETSAIVNCIPQDTQTSHISLTKTACPTTYSCAGQLITYSLVITNDGKVDLHDVILSDLLADQVDYGTFDGSLAAGESVTCIATYTIKANDMQTLETNKITTNGSIPIMNCAASSGVINTATVTGLGPAGEHVSNAASATVNQVPEQVCSDDICSEIRSPVFTGATLSEIYVNFDYTGFAGFYYCIDADLGSESISVDPAYVIDPRTIDEGGLAYTTTIQDVGYAYAGWMADDSYPVMGFLGEIYVPVNNQPDVLSELIVDSNDEYTISIGGALDLGDGYVLTPKQIDDEGSKVWLELSKNSIYLDDQVITVDPSNADASTWDYEEDGVGGQDDVLIMRVHVKETHKDGVNDFIVVEGLWLISNEPLVIESDDIFDMLMVTTIGDNYLKLTNREALILGKGGDIQLAGDLRIAIADSDDVRFYFYKEITAPGAYDVRSSVATGTTVWDYSSFAGFLYDLDSNISFEDIAVTVTDPRTIAAEDLVYTSTIQNVWYEYDGWNTDGSYPLLAFFGDVYVPVNGRSDILSSWILDSKDKYSLAVGDVLELGEGYELKVKQLDYGEQKIWLELYKNGLLLGDGVITVDPLDADASTWNYEEDNVGGENDVVIMRVHVGDIFHNEADSFVIIDGIWLISNEPMILTADQVFGNLQVTNIGPDSLTLKNSADLVLTKGEVLPLADGWNFRIADSDELRYYLFEECTICENAEYWLNIGVDLLEEERYEEALLAFYMSLGLDPEYADAWLGSGVALLYLERYEEALQVMDIVIELNPEYPFAWDIKGIAFYCLGAYEEAVQAFDKALELNPLDIDAWYLKGGILIDLERYEEALQAFDKVIELDPQNADAWYLKGVALEALGRYDEAQLCYDKAEELRYVVTNIRGPIFAGNSLSEINVVFNYTEFAGFYYDIDADQGSESISVDPAHVTDPRNIEEGGLVYTTAIQDVGYAYAEWIVDNSYPLIGFLGEEYVAVNNKPDVLSKLIMDSNDEYTIGAGESLDLGDGYVLTAKEVDVEGNKVWLELSKDGIYLDDVVVTLDISDADASTWDYKGDDVGGEDDVLVMRVHVNEINQDGVDEFIIIEGLWLISNEPLVIESDDTFGMLMVVTIGPDSLTLKNKDAIAFTKGEDLKLGGDIKIKIADSDDLRFFFYKEITGPGTYDVRSSVATGDAIFDYSSFAGFYYDLDYDISSETLAIASGLTADDRTIEGYDLTYTTTMQYVGYEYGEWGANYEYPKIGFLGEEYVPINDKPNMLSKIIMDSDDEYNISVGESLDLGDGYTLTLRGIDLSGTKVWLELARYGEYLGDQVVTVNPLDADASTWDYAEDDLGGEDNVVIMRAHVKEIRQDDSFAIVEGLWLISNDPMIITTGDVFGNLEVTDIGVNSLILMNYADLILAKGETILLADDWNFRVADSDELRYYLFEEGTMGENTEELEYMVTNSLVEVNDFNLDVRGNH
jgi:S-layer protein (TIGR01567 family)